MITFLLLALAGVAIIGALCEFAPEGYQDEKGFHYGKKPPSA
jgi:hypothetical protein